MKRGLKESGARTTNKVLYDAYLQWCENSACDPVSGVMFGKQLTQMKLPVIKAKKGNARSGIALKGE